jgi:hypothetical protein
MRNGFGGRACSRLAPRLNISSARGLENATPHARCHENATIPHSAICIPRFRLSLANLAFKYPDQLLNRGRQTKLLACCTQTGSAQVLSLFRVQEQSSDG